MTSPPVVTAENLSLRIGDRLLWSNVSFQLGRGELLAVLGPNGVGKTSLLRVLLGLRRPTAGRVRIDGEDYRQIEFTQGKRMSVTTAGGYTIFYDP